MKKQGFTLVELLVGIAISALVIIFGIQLSVSQEKERKKEEASAGAFSQIRQFFDVRRKFFLGATQTTFNSYGTPRFMNSKNNNTCTKGDPWCQEVFNSLQTKRPSSDCPGQVITEMIQVECVEKSPNVPEIDLGGLPGAATQIFANCAGSMCSSSAQGMLGTSQADANGNSSKRLPRIRITRLVPKKDSTTGACLPGQTVPVVSFFPPSSGAVSSDGSQGNPVAAVFCLQVPPGQKVEKMGIHCGTDGAGPALPPVGTPPDANITYCIDCDNKVGDYPTAQQTSGPNSYPENCPVNYRDFSLQVFAITRYGQNNFDLVQQTAAFPRPKIIGPNSIRPQ